MARKSKKQEDEEVIFAFAHQEEDDEGEEDDEDEGEDERGGKEEEPEVKETHPYREAVQRVAASARQQEIQGAVGLLTSNPVQSIAGFLDSLHNRGRQPGSLLPLLFAILVLLFAMVPVGSNGETRLVLLWRALTGGAYLPKSQYELQLEAEYPVEDVVIQQLVESDAQVAWDLFWAGATGVGGTL